VRTYNLVELFPSNTEGAACESSRARSIAFNISDAVEATRAGEQGRGFAVVASEVRILAQCSAAAAQEIKTFNTTSVSKVHAGAELVSKAGATMDEIVASVADVSRIMADIMMAGDEQSAGIGQINQAVIQMDATTQQNAALVEEACCRRAHVRATTKSLLTGACAKRRAWPMRAVRSMTCMCAKRP
jgi:hypothetical protein